MKIVRPVAIDAAALVSTSVPETVTPYSAATVYKAGDVARDAANNRLYESQQGADLGVVTITIATPGVVTCANHGLVADTPVAFTTTGALPTGLTAGTIYYVKSPATNTFQLAATAGGAAINTTGVQSGTHRLISNPNVGKALTNAAFWVDAGPSNPWAMFDEVNSTQTIAADVIDVTFRPGTRIDTLALINVHAAKVQVIATDAVDGEVFNQTFNLVSSSGIVGAYAYFTEPIEVVQDKVITGIPALYASLEIRVILTYLGSTVKLGALVCGFAKTIGDTYFGASTGIIDFSRKERDAFGNIAFVERGYANRGSFKFDCKNTEIEAIQRVLGQYRATPVLYLGTDLYATTFIFGVFRDFSIVVEYPTYSICSIELEGLI